MGGLPHNSKEGDIYVILSRFAAIEKITLKRRKNRPGGKCLGHGILVTNAEGASSLLALKHFEYQDRKVTMTPYLEGDQLDSYQSNFSQRRIFLIDFPIGKEEYTETDEARYLSFNQQFGKIESSYFRKMPGFEQKIYVVIFTTRNSRFKALEYYLSIEARAAGFLVAKDIPELKAFTHQKIKNISKYKYLTKSPLNEL